MAETSYPKGLESPESSSPVVTRAVAAGLAGEPADTYRFPAWQQWGLQLLGRLPQGAARFVISRMEGVTGLVPARLEELRVERLAEERLGDYAGLEAGRRYPNITLGAALGGATASLALALGGPFLPQAFVITLKGGSPDGDPGTYYRRSAGLAQRIAAANPGVLTIQHYDPVHDEWMTRRVNHLRLKLLDLPDAYERFIRARLEPGGSITYLDSGAQWLRYRVGERSVFQVGGWGGIPAQEFLEGSARLRDYCQRVGLSACNWDLPGFPLESGPESEWGCEAGLGEALEDFCARQGYRFVQVRLPEPHDYSRLAFEGMRRLLEREGRPPGGVLVEMFSQFDPWAARQGGLLPLWLVYNTPDSLAFLKEMRPVFPPETPVFFSPLATFTQTPDIVPFEEWEAALGGLDWRNVGARKSHYPADALALMKWAKPLRAHVRAHSNPAHGTLRAEELSGHL